MGLSAVGDAAPEGPEGEELIIIKAAKSCLTSHKVWERLIFVTKNYDKNTPGSLPRR